MSYLKKFEALITPYSNTIDVVLIIALVLGILF